MSWWGARTDVGRDALVVASAVAFAFVLVGCAPEPGVPEVSTQATAAPTPTPLPTPTPAPEPAPEVSLVSVTDGDTIETSAGAVRIIGIDTPERGECGYEAAAQSIRDRIAPGDPVFLDLPVGQNDQDRYGRLIRYVITEDGADIGLVQIEAGNAVARYDSRDGYPEHPREAEYHAAQIATLAEGRVVTPECATERGAAPARQKRTENGDPWYQAYASCAALKRDPAGNPTGPFDERNPAQVDAYQWFAYGTGNRGDGDGDGLACE